MLIYIYIYIYIRMASSSPCQECFICQGGHGLQQCPYVPPTFWTLQPSKMWPPAADGPGGPARPRLRLTPRQVVTRDVPGDGNCLFHALGIEVQTALPAASLSPDAAPGQAWREAMLRHVRHSRAPSMDGHTPAEWVVLSGWTLEAYQQEMSQPGSQRSWGGQLEVCLIQDMLRQHNLRIVILGSEAECFIPLHATGPPAPDTTIYVCWTGDHYIRARLQLKARPLIAAWCVGDR